MVPGGVLFSAVRFKTIVFYFIYAVIVDVQGEILSGIADVLYSAPVVVDIVVVDMVAAGCVEHIYADAVPVSSKFVTSPRIP